MFGAVSDRKIDTESSCFSKTNRGNLITSSAERADATSDGSAQSFSLNKIKISISDLKKIVLHFCRLGWGMDGWVGETPRREKSTWNNFGSAADSSTIAVGENCIIFSENLKRLSGFLVFFCILISFLKS